MSSSDFCIELVSGKKQKRSTLFFRFSSKDGGVPIICGMDSELDEFSIHVTKTLKTTRAPKRKREDEVTYRKQKRDLFYDEEESDSTECTEDD